MTVKEIIIRALKFAGREDVAEKAEKGLDLETEEEQSLETMLYCFNAVEDELARFYFPLVYKEDCAVTDGKLSFTQLSHKPIKMLCVSAYGKEIPFEQSATHITAAAPAVTVKYGYSPSKKSLSDNCSFDEEVTLKMLAAGSASEYSLINGEMKQAEFWESVYREEIDRVKRKKIADVKLPPRRWV